MTGVCKHVRAKHPAQRPVWYYGLILLICVTAIGWALFSRHYYAWALGHERINIVIFCDTSELNHPDLKAVVLYDQIALTPLARALGLYQNRPPGQVKTFFPVRVREIALSPVSITLKDVRWGPLCRILFTAKGKKFHVNIPDRRIFNHTLYIRVPPPDIAE